MSSHSISCAYLLAQQLNNSAARCIEIGHYGRAICSLKKALEINKNKKQIESRRIDVSKHSNSTLDGCIVFSEKNRLAAATFKNSLSRHIDAPNAKRRRIELTEAANARGSVFWRPPRDNVSATISPEREEQDLRDGYIYCQPILVYSDGMGDMLFLVVIFNLALAHHLEAMGAHHSKKKRDIIVQKTLSLYELTYKCYQKLLSDDEKEERTSAFFPSVSCSSVASIRFNMILQNNLSQLHRLLNDHSKYEQCRKLLLSSVMVALDYNTRFTSGAVSSGIRLKDPRAIEIEGFLTNTTSLVLGEQQCAEAA